MSNGLTAFLAAWGAVVATGALLWNILRDRKDKADVQVTVFGAPASGRLDVEDLLIGVANVGKRPAVVVGCSLMRLESGRRSQVIPALSGVFPFKLDEAESATINCGEIRNALADGLEEIRVIGTGSRVWRAKKRAILKSLARSREVREHFLKVMGGEENRLGSD